MQPSLVAPTVLYIRVRSTPAASVNADPYLNALLVKYCDEAVAGRRKQSANWQLKVENAIAPLLPHGQARIGKIASELAVSQRTLVRRLASEGLSFRALLDRLRFDLAKRYLREREIADCRDRVASGLSRNQRILPCF